MSCVVLGVTGGIAAYKSAEIASQLKKQGHDVYVIMTKHATEFIAPLTFETLTNHPVVVDMFTRETPWEVEHIALAKRADVFLVAPASANFLGKYANGIADDMLTTTVLATKAPVVLAPAMNTNMWSNAIVQKNVEALKSFGVSMVGPGSGYLACGDLGQGRMSEPEEIVEAVHDALAQKDLNGKRILVTAGPTRETVDPVRYITNHSSGKMGFAIARAAKRRGAAVTLIHGPVALPLPYGVEECAAKHAGYAGSCTGQIFRLRSIDYGGCPCGFYDARTKQPQNQKSRWAANGLAAKANTGYSGCFVIQKKRTVRWLVLQQKPMMTVLCDGQAAKKTAEYDCGQRCYAKGRRVWCGYQYCHRCP